MILRVAAWIAQQDTSILLARSEAIRLCLAAFDKAGIYMPETTLRILSGAGGAERPGPTPPAGTRAPPPAEVGVQPAPATAEAELERIIDSEREALQDEDLLNHRAPEE